MDALTQGFAMFDADGDEKLNYAEFKMMYEVSEIHFPFLKAQLLQLTLSLVTYSLMQVMMNGAQGDQTAKRNFDVMDTDGDLLITFEEMRVSHESLNIKEEKTRAMLDYGDTDGDGALNFEEFKAISKMQRN